MDRQRGIALVVSLVLLIMVMLLGMSAAQLSLQGEKAARSERDRDVAFLMAEDAVKNAEREIEGGGGPFAEDCAAGRYERTARGETPVWQRVDLSGGACAVTSGADFAPFRKPRYIVERMVCHQAGDDASAGAPPNYCYRVTAIGFASAPEMEVVLQSVYSKPEEAP
ncbi:pilus assembly PilX family protein [Duganella sp. PWIR1]